MAVKECPSCAVEIDKSAKECPICGYEFPKQRSIFKWVAIVLIVLFVYPLIRLLMSLFT